MFGHSGGLPLINNNQQLQTPAADRSTNMTQEELTNRPNSDSIEIVDDYRAKLEHVADLVARIRHEINNPLTGVLGQAQLLLREDLNDRARKRAQTIEELAMRIRDIVAQLREVQRPTDAPGSATMKGGSGG